MEVHGQRIARCRDTLPGRSDRNAFFEFPSSRDCSCPHSLLSVVHGTSLQVLDGLAHYCCSWARLWPQAMLRAWLGQFRALLIDSLHISLAGCHTRIDALLQMHAVR